MIANTPDIHGWHIYKDKKGYVVYYNVFNHQSYILKKDNEKSYRYFSNRLSISLVVGILTYAFSGKAIISVLIAAVLYALWTAIFFGRFLPSLDRSNYVPDHIKGVAEDFIKYHEEAQFIGSWIALMIAAVVIIILMSIDHSGSTSLYVLLLALSLGFALFFFICLLRKKKGENSLES